MRLIFPDFRPDEAALDGFSRKAENVIPSSRGYGPLQAPVQVSDALNARCRGAYAARSSDGVTYSYAGDATKLYELETNATHTDITNTGGAYSLTTNEFWRFVRWKNTVVALSIGENPQSITFGGANFADLSGSPPKAQYGAVVNRFLMLANINDGSAKPTHVRWSAIDDNTDWTIDPDTQADQQELLADGGFGGGEITGIVGGEYGVIFLDSAIFRAEYVGSPLIFRFDEIQSSIGCAYPNSLTKEGRVVHFIAEDGFYQLVDGTELRPIGENRVNQYFFDRVNPDGKYRVVGASDPKSTLVFWIYPSSASADAAPDSMLIYDWLNDKWSTASISLEWIYGAPTLGYSLEDLDNVNSNLEELSPSMDSGAWKSKDVAITAYDGDNKKVEFTGDALKATVDTAEYQPNEMGRSYVDSVTPLVDGPSASAKVAIGTRDLQQGTVSFTSPKSPNSRTGACNFRVDGRYIRARVTTEMNYNHLLGVDVNVKPSGAV